MLLDKKILAQKHPSSFKLLNDLKLCVFDLETTGGNHKSDKIIEIGLVHVDQLEIKEQKNILINPQIPIPDFIQKLTSIRPSRLKGCPRIEDVIEEILDFMGDRILVAHNASFDVPFFNSVLERLNIPKLQNPSLCTNLMTKYLIPEIMNSNLNYMSRIFQIPHHKAHRALEDAMATASLLITYLNFYIQKDIRKINQLYYPRNKYELDRVHYKAPFKKEIIIQQILKIKTPMIISCKGPQGVLLSVLPVESPQEELSMIEECLLIESCETISLRMVGSFMDAFSKFSKQFPKLSQGEKDKTLNYLFRHHLNRTPPDDHKIPPQQMIYGKVDFILAPHLIPEQFVIFPIWTFKSKAELVFRYPGHRKKFHQFVRNNCRRLFEGKRKSQQIAMPRELAPFFHLYLGAKKKEEGSQYFLFSKEDFTKDFIRFEKSSEKFFSENHQTHNYPKEHI